MSKASFQINTFVLGPLATNTYVLQDGDACWVVDPAMWPGPLVQFIQKVKLSPQRILLTHAHGDHIAGIGDLKSAWPQLEVFCPAGDADMLADASANMSAAFDAPITAPPAEQLIQPGRTLTLGQTQLEVLDTSGHTPGGVSYYCPHQSVVLTGDALFAGSIGRCDIPGASESRLTANIRNHLLNLPDETVVLPGHGPHTTIGAERRGNPFLS
ncbi:MAG: MBL fold metallo-hydrolase [Planctomycetota bacterium]|nr:MBL fold metallo-hydrolase [Planctomycetota bacterium]